MELTPLFLRKSTYANEVMRLKIRYFLGDLDNF